MNTHMLLMSSRKQACGDSRWSQTNWEAQCRFLSLA